MERFRQALIEVGNSVVTLTEPLPAALNDIPRSYFQYLAAERYSRFEFLASDAWADAFAFMRGLTAAEATKRCPFPGSTSLLVPAFGCCMKRERAQSATIADWIVKNFENPYVPFGFRRTREYWVAAAVGSPSPDETWKRVAEMEQGRALAAKLRASKHEVSEAIRKLASGEAPSSESLRERVVHELERQVEDRQEFPESR